MSNQQVFVTGATGYLGRHLIPRLAARGRVLALVRPGSERRLPAGCTAVVGNALERSTFVHAIPSGATLVHLVGTPHPSPAKAQQFQEVDLVSVREAVAAAVEAPPDGVRVVAVAQIRASRLGPVPTGSRDHPLELGATLKG